MNDVAAVILAGGKSSRMGRDKAFLDYHGKTFIQQIIDEVEQLKLPIYISGDIEKLDQFEFPVIKDEVPNQGPVVALASSFSKLKAKAVLVVSCDVPDIKAMELKRLLEENDEQIDVTMFATNGKEMPLVALYNQSSFDAFQAALAKGERRLFNVIKQLKTKVLTYNGVLRNVNTPNDFETIK